MKTAIQITLTVTKYERYTGDFDTHITFLKTGHFTVIKAIGNAPDSLIEVMGKTEAEKTALKKVSILNLGIITWSDA
jgi:precorrin isomerase